MIQRLIIQIMPAIGWECLTAYRQEDGSVELFRDQIIGWALVEDDNDGQIDREVTGLIMVDTYISTVLEEVEDNFLGYKREGDPITDDEKERGQRLVKHAEDMQAIRQKKYLEEQAKKQPHP